MQRILLPRTTLAVALSSAATVFLTAFCSAQIPIVSFGIPLGTDDAFEARVTSGGYMDVVIDTRMGFHGREYLSGEWAPAISYDGHPPMWLSRWHIFPDYMTNSDLDILDKDGNVVLGNGATPMDFQNTLTEIWVHPDQPVNKDGFTVLQSRQRNAHVEITHRYEFCKAPGGMAQGLSPVGGAQTGMLMQSSEFAYVHTLTFRNISDTPLENFNYYHLIHSLQADYVVYDDTDHGGFMGDYRYDFTQRGTSYGAHSENGGIYRHTDYVTLHSKVQPDAYEVGNYGVRGVDDHQFGKPATGVHLAIENDTFSNRAEFSAEDTRGWVAGAARYPLGTIGVGETLDFSLFMSLITMSELAYPDPGVILEAPQPMGDHWRLRVRDPNDLFTDAFASFLLYSSVPMIPDDPDTDMEDENTWMPELVPLTISQTEMYFDVPREPLEPRKHFRASVNFASF